MLLRLFFLSLLGCAKETPPVPSTPTPPRPHEVTYDSTARVVSCPKMGTSLALSARWESEQAGEALLLRRTDCRAVLVVRAGRLSDRAADFERDWAIAQVPLADALTEMRAHAAELGVAHTQADGVAFRYELDQLANLTCTFMVVGDTACVGQPLAPLARAPSILRSPPPAAKEKPTRNMGPNGDSRMHDTGGRY